jgi:hypothetical protein
MEAQEVDLWDNVGQGWIGGTLWRQPDPQLVLRAEEQWRGWMEGVSALSEDRGLALELPFTYGHWPWGDFAIEASKTLHEEIYTVTRISDGGTRWERVWVEGMMLLSTLALPCRAASHVGKPAIYLDLIATAPWNLPGVLTPPRYKFTGLILMRQAIDASREIGLKGRLGLHALDDAAAWYRKLGMVSLGRDPAKENLEYFELEEAAAEALYPSEGEDDEKDHA